MLLISLFCPLLAAVITGCWGRRIGQFGAQVITIGGLFFSLIIVIYTFSYVDITSYFTLYSWCQVGIFSLTFEFLFDNITFTMLFVVLFISAIVHIYSTQYLANDPHLPRFLCYLSLFTFFMLILVSAENLMQIFVGWEGVGLCSYLLINFWYTRIQAGKSALKAIFVNKIGDIAVLIGISFAYFLFGSTSFTIMFALVPYLQDVQFFIFNYLNALSVISFCFLLGAIGKSAQIGLHIWLPDAMEGPTPVSALLHAATMVTAGIFLIIRCSFLFEHTPNILLICIFIGSLTAFFAATTGLLQNDLKRIIAFSTCSQLGYMLVACGFSQYSLALFHLFNHAFFKALLFLAAGSVIHAVNDEQDIRKMGGLFYFMPLTLSFFLIASLSLMGFPFLSGFYSKDLIIETVSTSFTLGRSFALLMLLLAAFSTAAYSFRLIYYVFLTRPNFFFFNLIHLQDSSFITQAPLAILCLFSIFSGYLFTDLFVGFGTTFFNHALTIKMGHVFLIDNDFLSPFSKNLPLLFSLLGGVTGYFIVTRDVKIIFNTPIFYYAAAFLNQKWYFDKIYNSILLLLVKRIYFFFVRDLDKGTIEFFGPTGGFLFFAKISNVLKKGQSGYLSNYLLFIYLTIFFSLVFFHFYF